jgi:hypothetical protein
MWWYILCYKIIVSNKLYCKICYCLYGFFSSAYSEVLFWWQRDRYELRVLQITVFAISHAR